MSLGICSACKNVDSCTFPRNRTITQCEEYVNAGPHPVVRRPKATERVSRVTTPDYGERQLIPVGGD